MPLRPRWIYPMAFAVTVAVAACGSSGSTSPTPTATPTATPTTTPLFSATPSATPLTGVLDVTQLGFHMTLQHGVGTVSYSIDSSNAGPTTDLNGTQAKLDGVVGLNSSTYDMTPGCQPSGGGFDAVIEVYETSAMSLQFASGPEAWKNVGKYLLGFTPPQENVCADSPRFLGLLKAMFVTAAAD